MQRNLVEFKAYFLPYGGIPEVDTFTLKVTANKVSQAEVKAKLLAPAFMADFKKLVRIK